MVEVTELIEPITFTEPIALLIIGILAITGYFVVKFQHSILAIFWMLTFLSLGMTITIGLEFIWFWIAVMLMVGIIGIAGIFRFLVIPIQEARG